MKSKQTIIKLLFSLFLSFLFLNSSFSQDGKLLKRRKFKVDKSVIEELNNEYPEANFADTFALATMSNITYKSDGNKIKGFLIEPTEPGNYPCLIYNRDGYENTDALNEITVARDLHKIARWGYIVIASQYRGAAGSEGVDQFGGDDVNDILNLIPVLGKISNADTSRIGMFGRKRGGLMTYLALRKSEKIDAAVVIGGISNIFLFAAESTDYYEVLERLVPNYPEQRVAPLIERSMLYWPEELCKETPILIMHGSADSEVHPTQSINAFEKLFKEEHPTKLIIFEGGDNKITEHKTEVDNLFKSWINKYVRDNEDFPNIMP